MSTEQIAPPATIVPTLRSVGLPTGTLRIVAPAAITPRPVPKQPATRPLPVRDYDKGAYDAAHTALQQRDRVGTPAAWAAFGDDADSKPAIPKIPSQRKPTSVSPSAA